MGGNSGAWWRGGDSPGTAESQWRGLEAQVQPPASPEATSLPALGLSSGGHLASPSHVTSAGRSSVPGPSSQIP